MKQRKQQHVQPRQPGPAVRGQHGVQLPERGVVRERARGGVCHEDHRQHDFIGRQPEEERH